MIFFVSKESKSKKIVFFLRGWRKGGLASVSEFVLQRIKSKFFFVCVGGGGGRGVLRRGGGLRRGAE